MRKLVRKIIEPVRAWRRFRALPREAKDAIKQDSMGNSGTDPGIDAVVRGAIDWLYRAQDNSADADGGCARHFSLVNGWGRSYPETTGYIVPTLLDWHTRSGDDDALNRARKMVDWLLAIQFPEGGFQGGVIGAAPHVPVTFNTGQILLGLAAGATAFDDPNIIDAMNRAAGWLVESQDDDGAWRSFPTPFASAGEKAYETHVSWGLFEAERVTQGQGYLAAGLRNVDWALGKQQPNGWFADCCLSDPHAPLTHTIGYAVRGVLEAWRASSDDKYLDAACRSLQGIATNIEGDGRLVGQFDADWQPAANWTCLTGSSQLADCFLMAGEATADDHFMRSGRLLNAYVRRTICVTGPEQTRGGVKGSFPVSGEYGYLEYLNWAAKFTIDANLREFDLFGESG